MAEANAPLVPAAMVFVRSACGAPIPDLRVRVSATATRFGGDGIIAADFLGRFSRWYVDRGSRLLVLGA